MNLFCLSFLTTSSVSRARARYSSKLIAVPGKSVASSYSDDLVGWKSGRGRVSSVATIYFGLMEECRSIHTDTKPISSDIKGHRL